MIGIFDSGMGGLTVAKALMDHLPDYDMIYFGDTARTPYGSKSPETVTGYALEDTEFLLRKGAKVIVVACNTASSVATNALAARFDVPIFEVISPAVENSLKTSRKYRIGIIGTRATITSGVYERKIKEREPAARVFSSACPLLVPLVEEGWQKRPETSMIVKKYLHPLKTRQIDTLILGCTHYPLIKGVIQKKIGKRVTVIDSSLALAEKVKQYITQSPEINDVLSRQGKARFFVSDVTAQFRKTARTTLKRNLLLEHVRL